VLFGTQLPLAKGAQEATFAHFSYCCSSCQQFKKLSLHWSSLRSVPSAPYEPLNKRLPKTIL